MFDNLQPETPCLSPGRRAAAGAFCLLLLGGFVLAALLQPDPRGYGTHQRLGLPGCSVRSVFGVACPSCGMTTSFSHFVRGRFRAAARSNAGGLLLALLFAAAVLWSAAGAVCGRLIGVHRPIPAAAWMLGLVLMVSIVQWLARVNS